MAGPSSSKFTRLANAFRLLSLRSDIDDLILELLGQFSLEKIYADGDKETYQSLVINLLAQLNAIFNIQRLTLPADSLQFGWYLGFLASWEVTLRTIEFVLQAVVDGREQLWESRLLREKYLAELLVNALRFLILHPKIPSSQRAKDRRDRFARLHRSLERIFDSYPGPESFLLLVCKEITDSLRSEPNGLGLPQKLKTELPNLATELYPIRDCLSSEYVTSIAPADGFPGDWLSQFLALRDVSQFVVGASLQYSVNQETRDVRLQSCSARTRNAVLRTLENIRLPHHLSQLDMIATFSETFRVVLPETLNLRRNSLDGQEDESDIDAIDALCARLNDRQVLHRVSDRELMHNVSQITRNIELLDDPSGHFKGPRPRLFALNCGSCHIVGETQLRNAEDCGFPLDFRESAEITLPSKAKCIMCREAITMMREVAVAKNVWELLKPLEPNVDTINVERHLSAQFQLGPPKVETGMPFHAGYGNILSTGRHRSQDTDISPSRVMFQGSISPDRSRTIPQALLMSPRSPGFSHMDTPRSDVPPSEEMTSSDKGYFDNTGTFGSTGTSDSLVKPTTSSGETSLPSGDSAFVRGSGQSRLQSMSTVSFVPEPLSRSQTAPTVAAPEKGKSRWRSKLTGSRRETPSRADSSSVSSGTLESPKTEEIQLKSLMSSAKSSSKGKGSKNVNAGLSQNSTYALFWTQTCINVWDISTSSPILGRAVMTESNCVLAAVTKMHLAYIIGTRDQKLTLRIVNLISASATPIEYRMPSSPWCHSLAICPRENYVVVGFDNAIVRFYNTSRSEEPREDRLHIRSSHRDCRACPPVNTLSFSNDGLNLLASTRSAKNGIIQVYSWRFPFEEFGELANCRYHVPLHESEDGGVSTVTFRSGNGGEENLMCVTTWTQSGIPVLFQPSDGHRSDIRTDSTTHQGKLGSRIQCAAFSPTGRELAMVNDKGHLYHITNLNSSPIEVKRIAISKELTTKSDWYAMTYMSLPDEEAIVLVWADASKAVAYVRKVPVKYNTLDTPVPMTPLTGGFPGPRYELPSEGREIPKPPVELSVDEILPLKISKEKEKA
ncbi:uncharacterized protein LY89DRAFT_740943 [Mollisia scopiformis]|uniref:WD40 repeat protein n=1 Tax=Mollisia scopiformis TaxID=149040 RepID=A0A132B9Y1_MOLSC|nr:uncharacterized protein LY89DRAFT_740943 [Mollisia scopiformis]KUJ09208.1 hypothetical protein LY89DRAFT_740943 [Mollisia scopiformis]